ncbi:MAG TPA: hypothetical protein VM915_05605, partial [Verrucomicrobiae bacterium]|nr:hypothetical protein [Verrucomicrobiae bacterium]
DRNRLCYYLYLLEEERKLQARLDDLHRQEREYQRARLEAGKRLWAEEAMRQGLDVAESLRHDAAKACNQACDERIAAMKESLEAELYCAAAAKNRKRLRARLRAALEQQETYAAAVAETGRRRRQTVYEVAKEASELREEVRAARSRARAVPKT